MPRSPAFTVWQYRARALLWAAVGVLSFPLGWADSVVLVWIASLYANVATDLGAAQAADDRAVLSELAAVRDELATLARRLHCPCCRHTDPPKETG